MFVLQAKLLESTHSWFGASSTSIAGECCAEYLARRARWNNSNSILISLVRGFTLVFNNSCLPKLLQIAIIARF